MFRSYWFFMGSIENYKLNMGSGLRAFFEGYEPAIKELIDNLDSDGILLRKFSEEQVIRLQNLTNSSNMALKLSNDFGSIFNPKNKNDTKEKLSYLKIAFNNENDFRIGEHYHSILTNTYIALLERLKMYFLFFIDWNNLGKEPKDIRGIGNALEVLKQKYPLNKYLLYFNTGTRNSLAHYTFFWKHGNGGKIKLCSEMFDENTEEIPFAV